MQSPTLEDQTTVGTPVGVNERRTSAVNCRDSAALEIAGDQDVGQEGGSPEVEQSAHEHVVGTAEGQLSDAVVDVGSRVAENTIEVDW